MANTTDREVKAKHRKRKARIKRNAQNSIANNAKKKTLEKLLAAKFIIFYLVLMFLFLKLVIYLSSRQRSRSLLYAGA
jgi:hypothetical protein